PDICFVLDWSATNNFSSKDNCVTKKDMSLKDYDNSLVWYWDMETLTADWKLKDLSGNGNDWTFSWGMNYSAASTGWIISKGLSFSNSWYSIVVDDDWTWSSLDITKNMTIEAIFLDNSIHSCIFLSKWLWPNYNYKLDLYIAWNYEFIIGMDWEQRIARSMDKYKAWNFIHMVWVYDWENLSVYENWIKKWTLKYIWNPNNNNMPLILWRYLWDKEYSLNWVLDEIKIYNRAASDLEIRQRAKSLWFKQ
ncbi:MAG: hypothetical protein ACD_3C00130G0016, partial [uncultured bacterium (gcode 4)]